MDGPSKSNQNTKMPATGKSNGCMGHPGAVAHIIEDAAKVLYTKSESSGMISLVATEG